MTDMCCLQRENTIGNVKSRLLYKNLTQFSYKVIHSLVQKFEDAFQTLKHCL